MKSIHAFFGGFAAGIAFSALVYLAVFHEGHATASPTGTTTGAARAYLKLIAHEVTIDSKQLAGLPGLPLAKLEEKLGLAPSYLGSAGAERAVTDEFVLEDYAGCKDILAFPVKNSGNFLVVGVLYGHVHVVSIFAPRWENSEPVKARESPR